MADKEVSRPKTKAAPQKDESNVLVVDTDDGSDVVLSDMKQERVGVVKASKESETKVIWTD